MGIEPAILSHKYRFYVLVKNIVDDCQNCDDDEDNDYEDKYPSIFLRMLNIFRC